MSDEVMRTPIAIVGVGAILPDAPDAPTFWQNIQQGRYSISEVTPELWDPQLFYDPDPKAADKTYSKIGGIVRDYAWDPLAWKIAVPPRVADAMDRGQKWAIACAREALADYGYPQRSLDRERTAVILGNAMAGDKHYRTALRVAFPEIAQQLEQAPSFAALPLPVRAAILEEARAGLGRRLPPITEDTMPGELANVIAGRVAQLFDLHGPNFVCDAACASAMAALQAAIHGLADGEFDAVLSGGIDANMSASTFVKFSKIGALSATGTRPFAAGADGFVMGEGAAVFLLKRLQDAHEAGDRVYAVIRGVGGASDGKGKGITAPNPVGQKLAIERAWRSAGLSLSSATLIEGHGTSTRVGDVVEVASLIEAFGAQPGERAAKDVALGSVKSNIGHLKAAAGAAGLLKAAFALRDKLLPPSLGFQRPNPDIDFAHSPLRVNTELREWRAEVRRVGVSAFGFGGTNFHVVLEEYRPEASPALYAPRAQRSASIQSGAGASAAGTSAAAASAPKAPLRGVLVAGGATAPAVSARLHAAQPGVPERADLNAAQRVAIDYGDAGELDQKRDKAEKALARRDPGLWKALRAQGVCYGEGAPGKLAFLFTGQGSQYVNMLRELREREPIVAATFAEADRVMTPILGRPLSEIIFVPEDQRAQAEEQLRQTAITQPAILATDIALARLLAAYGVEPDMVIGHSLGEYGALVAAGALPFDEALRAVAARGSEMTRVSVADNGAMLAVFAPLAEIERVLTQIEGYAVVANVNAPNQAVVGGETVAVARAKEAFEAAGLRAVPLTVSHAFHTSIVAPASEPLKRVLATLQLTAPKLPLVSNVTGAFYPETRAQMIELLGRQIAEPVQFVRGIETLYAAGARVFVEVGPKRALAGLADEVLAAKSDVVVLSTNHPKLGDVVSFNQALCGLYAAGLGQAREPATPRRAVPSPPSAAAAAPPTDALYRELGGIFADAMQRAQRLVSSAGGLSAERVMISGAALGLPGGARVFDDANVARLLAGEQLIDVIPVKVRRALVDKHITRLVKSDTDGGPRFETIDSPADVIKLAGRAGALDLHEEFGVTSERDAALSSTTRLAIAAGIDALRDAGIPLCLRYKTTTLGTRLPDRYMLPEALRDETGVIFASAFPSYGALAEDMGRYAADHARRERLSELRAVRERSAGAPAPELAAELERRIHALEHELDQAPYLLDRRYIFRILSMGHSQFAEYIGARGPNTQVNSACASGSMALSLAEDWIRAGRARRVIIVSADDVTSDSLLEWIGAGFLASGAAATEDVVEEVAIPFDRRRHGLVLGMGATALVVESETALRERGLCPIAELLGTQVANSAFHGSRLDVDHIGQVMERLVSDVERRHGIAREQLAPQSVFVSHETYTPARGGSAQAEVSALRRVFGALADRIVIANTKGFTGHAMGAAVEEAVAVKILETGIVPPVANFREVDPELGRLNLSHGGAQPVRYALRLGAGFGSQIALAALRWMPPPDGQRRPPEALGYAYRIADPARFRAFLTQLSGDPEPELEVVQRTLRLRDRGLGQVASPVVHAQPAAAPPKAAPQPRPAPQREPAPSPSQVAPAPLPDAVAKRVLSIVSEQTGYPPDMLALDLDLEADLGIDTVKQAETFAAVREAYQIPRDAALKLKDFPTLAHVVAWVKDKTGMVAPAPQPMAVAVAVAVAPQGATDEVQARVLSIVSEQTGYPPDMLDLDLDLEADLGIDTVKQAETFAAVREAYQIPRDAALKLKDFPTLAHVVAWVKDKRQGAAPAERTQPESVAPRSEAAAFAPRVPSVVVRPPIELCKATRVLLEAGARVLIVGGAAVAAALAARLGQRGLEPIVTDPAGALGALAAGPVAGVYWLVALEDEGDPFALDPTSFAAAVDARVKALARLARAFHPELTTGKFLIAATRLGGQHGVDAPATAPLGGAVTGFVKALKRERPEATIKAVDFGATEPEQVAELLLAETTADPGVVEVGYAEGLRVTLALREASAEPAQAVSLTRDSVYVVTGAAGSIVSAIVSQLCAAGGVFYLLDIAPAPDPNDPDLALFVRDRDALKRELGQRMQARGERATPALIERQLSAIERAVAAQAAIGAIMRAGGRAEYRRVDLRDPVAVAQVIDEVRAHHARVDLLLHAAGLEVSRLLPDKSEDEFDLVFDVKACGFYHVLHALSELPLGACVAFSSIAGRFGNAGQTDYAAANDLLCKLVSHLARTRPDTQGLVIDWTAWAGIGMATRGSIPKLMAAAGIDMLPAEVGVPLVGAALSAGARGEWLVAGALGALEQEWDPSGGLDAAAIAPSFAMVTRVVGWPIAQGLTVEATLDPTQEPFLFDHQIEGKAVLPGVMGIEAFAEVATMLLGDFRLCAIEDVSFAAPLKFYRNQPRTLRIEAQIAVHGAELEASCRLSGARSLAGDRAEQKTYFTARVRLSRQPPAPVADTLPAAGHAAVGPEAVYRVYFHGPAYQVLAGAARNGSALLGELARPLPPDHRHGSTVTPARLLELCFQTAGVWEIGTSGRMALPQHVDKLVVLDNPPDDRALYAVVTPRDDGAFDARIMDEGGQVFLILEGYRTVALGEVDAALRAPLSAAVSA